MSEIKVNLSIVIPGRTMWSEEECLKTTQEKHINNVKPNDQSIDGSKMRREHVKIRDRKNNLLTINYYVRKCKPAAQSINISKESYQYMVGKNSMLPRYKPNQWAAMNKKERLESHLKNICESLQGSSFTYQVFED